MPQDTLPNPTYLQIYSQLSGLTSQLCSYHGSLESDSEEQYSGVFACTKGPLMGCILRRDKLIRSGLYFGRSDNVSSIAVYYEKDNKRGFKWIISESSGEVIVGVKGYLKMSQLPELIAQGGTLLSTNNALVNPLGIMYSDFDTVFTTAASIMKLTQTFIAENPPLLVARRRVEEEIEVAIGA